MEQYHGAIDRVRFGQSIISNDGKNVGTVESMVLNTENNHLEQLVADQGLLSQPKLIDIDLIERIDPDRIVLSLSADQVESLPDFVVTQYVEAPASALAGLGPAWEASAIGVGRVYFGGPLGASAYPGGLVPPMDATDTTNPVVENVSNLPPQDVMISEGTDVVGADGKKVGKVDRVLFGDGGTLQGFVVKSGFIFRRDITVPINAVAEVGADEIRLSVSAGTLEANQ